MSRLSVFAVLALACATAAGCEEKKAAAPPPSAGAVRVDEAPPAAPAAPVLCEHQVPADVCTKCAPELAEVFKELGDWCAEHGLPESHCRACNPQLTFAAATTPADWCGEHGLTESMCTQCNPKLVSKFIEAGDYCREHGFPKSVCPRCKAEQGAAEPPADGLPDVRLASTETAREAGLRTVKVQKERFAPSVDVSGTVTFNKNRWAQLAARGEGVIGEVKVDVGDEVRAGQVLISLSSPGVSAEQARIASGRARVSAAQAAVEREKGLVAKGISPRQVLEQAEAELSSAQSELNAMFSSLGFSGASSDATGGRSALIAPFSGTVVSRDAITGRVVASGDVLLEIADTRSLWVELQVPEAQASRVKPGQGVSLQFEGGRAPETGHRVARVAPSVDRETRTVRALVELDNAQGHHKAGAFVRAQIQTGGEREAVAVPVGAVQSADGQALVFIRKDDSTYLPTRVVLGEEARGRVEVVSGLAPGAEVVTSGAFLLKTEILKDSIGAGCCEGEGE